MNHNFGIKIARLNIYGTKNFWNTISGLKLESLQKLHTDSLVHVIIS